MDPINSMDIFQTPRRLHSGKLCSRDPGKVLTRKRGNQHHSEDFKQEALDEFRKHVSIHSICSKYSISRTTFYVWRKQWDQRNARHLPKKENIEKKETIGKHGENLKSSNKENVPPPTNYMSIIFLTS